MNPVANRFRSRLPLAVACAAFAVALWTLPAAWCQLGADAWIEGGLPAQEPLARTVVAQVGRRLSTADYATGSPRFDGEWLFGTYLMAGIGLCQVVKQHPATAAKWTPAIEQCIRGLLSPEVREFDRAAWKSDALATLATNEGHAAYLGYVNFLLGLYREIRPQNPFADVHDKITAALARRLQTSPSGLLGTYPSEWYPVDNTPVIASLALHDRATGHRAFATLLEREEQIFRSRYVDAATGLLIQATDETGRARDLARGSGTALGIFFLREAFPRLGGELFAAIKKQLAIDVLGFAAIREYPHGVEGPGDIDSGPIVLGFGFSATGFTLAAARAYGDDALFARLYASAILAGAPVAEGGNLEFLSAGPLGNAILLAMFTTPRLP